MVRPRSVLPASPKVERVRPWGNGTAGEPHLDGSSSGALGAGGSAVWRQIVKVLGPGIGALGKRGHTRPVKWKRCTTRCLAESHATAAVPLRYWRRAGAQEVIAITNTAGHQKVPAGARSRWGGLTASIFTALHVTSLPPRGTWMGLHVMPGRPARSAPGAVPLADRHRCQVLEPEDLNGSIEQRLDTGNLNSGVRPRSKLQAIAYHEPALTPRFFLILEQADQLSIPVQTCAKKARSLTIFGERHTWHPGATAGPRTAGSFDQAASGGSIPGAPGATRLASPTS